MLNRGMVVYKTVVFFAVVALAGCARKRGTDMNAAVSEHESPRAAEPANSEAAPAAATEEPSKSDKPADLAAGEKAAKEEAEKLAKEAEQRQINRDRLARELAISRERLKQTQMAHDAAKITTDQSVAKAEKELEIARRRFETFMNQSVPNRIKSAELSYQYSQDSLKEAEEELEQLELMYKEEEFAEKTKEIVIDRAKRRIERSRTGLSIQATELSILKERTIPIETEEQRMAVEDKEKALAAAKRDAESTMLGHRINLMSGESDLKRIETEQAQLEKEEERARKAAAEKKG